jgi:pyruvate/2-oxoglutarate dehydrogenase complex dihydrolipoamide dehydrogenase (E3) component
MNGKSTTDCEQGSTAFDKMLLADDPYDRILLENCRPPNRFNPTPGENYNLVVVGGGTAGLVSAAGAAGLGAKVALVERNLMGGDCLNVGCVPSKAVIRAARAAHAARSGGPFGIASESTPKADFAAAMERMRRLRAEISRHDSVARFENLGIDVFIGHGRFIAPNAIDVDGKSLKFDRAVIASGARAAEPAVPGLKEIGFYTNETIFTLTELPRRLAVVGAGPAGCELAQSFQRLGSQVTLITDGAEILPKEDRDAAAVVRRQIEKDGVKIITGASLERAGSRDGAKSIWFRIGEASGSIACDAILLAVGRTPNLENLGLEAAGVRFTHRGVDVDERLRTANPRIFAAGDVCSRYRFTHAADAMARIVVANALFLARRKATDLVIPWCTYTDPEIAHVGYYEKDAQIAGFSVATVTRGSTMIRKPAESSAEP